MGTVVKFRLLMMCVITTITRSINKWGVMISVVLVCVLISDVNNHYVRKILEYCKSMEAFCGGNSRSPHLSMCSLFICKT